MALDQHQIIILRRLSDGALHNLFAYPLIEDHDAPSLQFKLMWAALKLYVKELIMFEDIEEADEALWMRILPEGRKALEAVDA